MCIEQGEIARKYALCRYEGELDVTIIANNRNKFALYMYWEIMWKVNGRNYTKEWVSNLGWKGWLGRVENCVPEVVEFKKKCYRKVEVYMWHIGLKVWCD